MGIHDLLKMFKPTMLKVNISQFRNKTAAVDMMTWLYRGVYSCSNELYLNSNITDLYLNYPLKMISLLVQNNISVIAVFDGKDLIAKAQEDLNRLENKAKNLELAAVIESTGDTEVALKVSKRALTVNDKMQNTLIAILKKIGIKVIIAPYEADAQIAYLCKQKICDFAISEDSDLIPYGCPNIMYKLQPSGEALIFEWEKFKHCWNYNENNYKEYNVDKNNSNNNHNFNNNNNNKLFTNDKNTSLENNEYDNKSSSNLSKELLLFRKMKFVNFIEFCVMLGCDYLESIKGYGVKGGVKLFNTYSTIDNVYERMCEMDKFKKEIDKFYAKNNQTYLNKAKKVVSLFLIQTVYNPRSMKLTSLNSLELNPELKYIIDHYNIKFNSENEKNEYYGSKFENSLDFCNCNSNNTLIDSEETIEKYYLKYKDICCKPNNNIDMDSERYKNYVFYNQNNCNQSNMETILNNPSNTYLYLDKNNVDYLFDESNKMNILSKKEIQVSMNPFGNKKINKNMNLNILDNKSNPNDNNFLNIDDDELDQILFNTKKENLSDIKEKIINKRVEELVKIQNLDDKPIKSLGDLISNNELNNSSKLLDKNILISKINSNKANNNSGFKSKAFEALQKNSNITSPNYENKYNNFNVYSLNRENKYYSSHGFKNSNKDYTSKIKKKQEVDSNNNIKNDTYLENKNIINNDVKSNINNIDNLIKNLEDKDFKVQNNYTNELNENIKDNLDKNNSCNEKIKINSNNNNNKPIMGFIGKKREFSKSIKFDSIKKHNKISINEFLNIN